MGEAVRGNAPVFGKYVMEFIERDRKASEAEQAQRAEAEARADAERQANLPNPGPELPVEQKPIDELELSVRSYNCLRNAEIETIGHLLNHSKDELAALRNMGRKNVNEDVDLLAEMGLALRGSEVPAPASDPIPEKPAREALLLTELPDMSVDAGPVSDFYRELVPVGMARVRISGRIDPDDEDSCVGRLMAAIRELVRRDTIELSRDDGEIDLLTKLSRLVNRAWDRDGMCEVIDVQMADPGWFAILYSVAGCTKTARIKCADVPSIANGGGLPSGVA